MLSNGMERDEVTREQRLYAILQRRQQILRTNHHQHLSELFYLENDLGGYCEFNAWLECLPDSVKQLLVTYDTPDIDVPSTLKMETFIKTEPECDSLKRKLTDLPNDFTINVKVPRLEIPKSLPTVESISQSKINRQDSNTRLQRSDSSSPRARREAHVQQRAAQLQREGSWSLMRLPRIREPQRRKTHWDYVIEETLWLAEDYAGERYWKRKMARELAFACAAAVKCASTKRSKKVARIISEWWDSLTPNENLNPVSKWALKQKNPDENWDELPIWYPPTPPAESEEFYEDITLTPWYCSEPMVECELPPLKPLKPQIVSPPILPRTIFHRTVPSLAKMRRELKEAKYRGRLLPRNGLSSTPNDEWLAAEDWTLLQCLLLLQELPLALTPVTAGHTPNFELASELIDRIYKSPRQCRMRYETIAREENRKGRRCSMNDRTIGITRVYSARFALVKEIASKRPAVVPRGTSSHSSSRHAAVLEEHGIRYDEPQSAQTLSQIRAERVQRERKLNQAKLPSNSTASEKQKKNGNISLSGSSARFQHSYSQVQRPRLGSSPRLPQQATIPRTSNSALARTIVSTPSLQLGQIRILQPVSSTEHQRNTLGNNDHKHLKKQAPYSQEKARLTDADANLFKQRQTVQTVGPKTNIVTVPAGLVNLHVKSSTTTTVTGGTTTIISNSKLPTSQLIHLRQHTVKQPGQKQPHIIATPLSSRQQIILQQPNSSTTKPIAVPVAQLAKQHVTMIQSTDHSSTASTPNTVKLTSAPSTLVISSAVPRAVSAVVARTASDRPNVIRASAVTTRIGTSVVSTTSVLDKSSSLERQSSTNEQIRPTAAILQHSSRRNIASPPTITTSSLTADTESITLQSTSLSFETSKTTSSFYTKFRKQ